MSNITSTTNTQQTYGGPGATSPPSNEQLASTGAQIGADAFLARTFSGDAESFAADLRGSLAQRGLTPEQIATTVDYAVKAFKAAAALEAGAVGTSGGAGATGGTSPLSYDAFIRTVGSEVLPANVTIEPKPAGSTPLTLEDKTFQQNGNDTGKNIPAGSSLASVMQSSAQRLQAAGASPHQVAIFLYALESGYNQAHRQTSGGGGASTGAAGGGASTGAANTSGTGGTGGTSGTSPPDPGSGLSTDFRNWFNPPANQANVNKNYQPTFQEWQTFIKNADALRASDPAKYTALVEQLKKSHGDWAKNLVAAITLSSSDGDRAAKTYKPFADILPKLTDGGDEWSLATAQAFSKSDFTSVTKKQFGGIAAQLLDIRKNKGDAAYQKALGAIADGKLKKAVEAVIDQQWGQNKDIKPTDFAKQCENAFSSYNDGKRWINDGAGDATTIASENSWRSH